MQVRGDWGGAAADAGQGCGRPQTGLYMSLYSLYNYYIQRSWYKAAYTCIVTRILQVRGDWGGAAADAGQG